jgi:hypothetical protein
MKSYERRSKSDATLFINLKDKLLTVASSVESQEGSLYFTFKLTTDNFKSGYACYS